MALTVGLTLGWFQWDLALPGGVLDHLNGGVKHTGGEAIHGNL